MNNLRFGLKRAEYIALFFILCTVFILQTFSTSAYALDKNKFYFTAKGEILGGYSKIIGSTQTGSLLGDWLIAPSIKLSERLFWINFYNGSYNHSAQVVAQEQGGQQASTTQAHSISSALKYDINDTWSVRPLFFVDWIFVQDTKDESFGNGLYDYRDIGGGIESAWTTVKTQDRHDEVRLGFRALDRHYPNYKSLLYLFIPGGSPEVNEKDLSGYKINLSYDSRNRDTWSWGAEGIFFFKDFTDKKTIDSNGVLTNSSRQDTIEYANVYVSRPLSKDITFRLDGQFAANQSNLDYYDTRNTMTPADDNFIPSYFDYYSWLVRPSLTYRKPMGNDKSLLISTSYTFNPIYYPDRNTQDASGAYQSSKETDYTHTLATRVSIPLTANFSWVTSASYTISDSNQKFDRYYLYSYDLWMAVTGISASF